MTAGLSNLKFTLRREVYLLNQLLSCKMPNAHHLRLRRMISIEFHEKKYLDVGSHVDYILSKGVLLMELLLNITE